MTDNSADAARDLAIERLRQKQGLRTMLPDAVAETFLRVLDNQADATVGHTIGHIVSMTPSA